MDRNSILAIVLISLLILGYMFYSSQNMPEQSEIKNADSTVVKSDDDNDAESLFKNDGVQPTTATTGKKELQYGKFQTFTQGTREVVTIESDLYIAKLSSKGGDLISWELKNYNKWDGVPSQLINDKEGVLYLDFISAEGKDIDSRNLYFTFDSDKSKVKISGEETHTITATLEVEPGKTITKVYKFSGNKYAFDTGIELKNMEEYIPRNYLYKWSKGLTYQEKNSVDESGEALAIVQMNGEEYWRLAVR